MNRSRVETRIVLTPAQHFTVSEAPVWTLCVSRKLTIFPRGEYADGGLWALRAEPGRALGPPAHRAPRHCPSRLRAEELPSGKLGSQVPPVSSAGKGGGLSSPLPFVRAGERAGLLVHCFFPSSRRQGFPSLKGYRSACDSVASTEPPPPPPPPLQSSQRWEGGASRASRAASGSTPVTHASAPAAGPFRIPSQLGSADLSGVLMAPWGEGGSAAPTRWCSLLRSARGPPAAPSPLPRPMAPSRPVCFRAENFRSPRARARPREAPEAVLDVAPWQCPGPPPRPLRTRVALSLPLQSCAQRPARPPAGLSIRLRLLLRFTSRWRGRGSASWLPPADTLRRTVSRMSVYSC
ncbi:wiskott-Aldrich syndrome protein homolog 1-like [Delphinapterus leucas]|uniref:Wiskott-Aldrich syndrome protein homolog 1-like n=1 Tax=Delphinapterus leucas TaxID=9749 RepID=A0A7F8JZR5_DELLE|nr:wiskott-Aldrich syndrome protein homolog 1-like [Delphinapterus leucas]XP_030615177.1 wiskott-Aldrich syndrome protein homolog 1-like [Delphinapterus leucas]XP_030615178.1 wiskott-Aldrich syndrome protein homolog 1-like [Delphinapterus leucas]XP_030615179.1 wiskott-Aldrich syndrome protein homolog 1-like [Delphinapterus leucas]XP_030615180.1 wiskott-Aldrich syndrome protein homolog 1-like [Delphinapterus leucas]XP_030615181.1 wiskott-Aldrich syndrome protein homolog 1-like [Delphinapterus l